MNSANFLKEIYQNKNQSNDAMALVVQGGGMRGVYSMAVLAALEELKFSEKFDYIIGSSAGAINGAYFIAKQAKIGTEAYINELSVSDFISFFRFKKNVDIDFLIDLVVKNTIKLCTKRIEDSKIKLEIVLTNSKAIQAKYLNTKQDTFQLCESLRATMALPILYGKEVQVLGEGYIDGGISDYVPLNRAIEKGYKKIVVVLTSEFKYRKDKFKFLTNLFTLHKKTKLRKALLCEDERFNAVIDTIKLNHPNIQIICIAPSDKKRLVGTVTKNQMKLLDCALMAREDVYAKLGVKISKNKHFFNLWKSKAKLLNKT